MEFLDARCPSCGGELKVPSDRSTIKCMYCGCDILVRDAIAKGGVDPANLLALANLFLEQENSDKADEYFDRVLETDPQNIIAWLGKYQARTLKKPLPYMFDDDDNEYNGRARILITCINLTDKSNIDNFIMLLYNINRKGNMFFTANGAMEALRDILKAEYDKTYKSTIYYKYEIIRLANVITNTCKDVINKDLAAEDYNIKCKAPDIHICGITIYTSDFIKEYPDLQSYIKMRESSAIHWMKIDLEYLNKYLTIIREVEPEYKTHLDEAVISFIKENVTGIDISNIGIF